MEIEVSKEKLSGYVHFSSLEIGDAFALSRNDLHTVWMKIKELDQVQRAINLNYGEIEYFQPTAAVIPLDAKLIVKEKRDEDYSCYLCR